MTNNPRATAPSLALSLAPIILLLSLIIGIIIWLGADAVQPYSYLILLGAAALSLTLSKLFTRRRQTLLPGIMRSARQILPAVPILLLIGTLSSTWMLSGVVPGLIYYGLELLSPSTFLFVSCFVCAVISVVTGSSWTTIATIGVALMGVGAVMGYSEGWVAGAIISGAYFGDKVSPLSDTTVLASSSCGVPLLTHIRFLMLTSIPAIAVALAIYWAAGYFIDPMAGSHGGEIMAALESTFNLSAWVLVIPAITITMLAMRAGTVLTLAIGSVTGLIGIWVFQPQLTTELGTSVWEGVARVLFTSTSVDTGSAMLNPLISTSGIEGMLPTVWLVMSAMIFGGVMIGTGMLGTITHAITRRLSRARSLVSVTVGSGLFVNCCTADQYLSIIIGGNVFRNAYRRMGVKPQVLSRALEDSISVTSVLIPWNSCGVTQSTVLGVATLVYLPFCVFNYLSPLMSIAMAWLGFRIHAHRPQLASSASGSGGSM